MIAQAWIERLGLALVQFLWQGAVIAAVYAVLGRWASSRSAQVRYGLACATLIVLVLAPVITFVVSGAADSDSVGMVAGAPVPTAESIPRAGVGPDLSHTSQGNAMPWVVAAWFSGMMVCSLRLAGGCAIAVRMRSRLVGPAPGDWQQRFDALRMRLRVSRPVRLLVSGMVDVPTVTGWLRPVVLAPLGALTGLDPESVEALLAHELAHVRRHDYFVNVAQGIVEAVLFYHPAVWWISAQIRREREYCCDDVAVSVTGNALTYVRALADLELRRPAHAEPLLAANGGSVVDRMSRLLGRQSQRPGPLPGVGAGLVVLMAGALALLGQAASAPVFEVASVKTNSTGSTASDTAWSGEGGTLRFVNVTLRNCVQIAYQMKPSQIETPDWMDSLRYDITAKSAGSASDGQIREMLQTLLAERFGMTVHRESRSVSAYTLMVAKGGPKLKESERGARVWNDSRRGRLEAHGMAMADFVDKLAESLDRPVRDGTGLKSGYEIALNWTPAEAAGEGLGESIFAAVQDQLGLKLESDKASVDYLVVDRASKIPTGN